MSFSTSVRSPDSYRNFAEFTGWINLKYSIFVIFAFPSSPVGWSFRQTYLIICEVLRFKPNHGSLSTFIELRLATNFNFTWPVSMTHSKPYGGDSMAISKLSHKFRQGRSCPHSDSNCCHMMSLLPVCHVFQSQQPGKQIPTPPHGNKHASRDWQARTFSLKFCSAQWLIDYH